MKKLGNISITYLRYIMSMMSPGLPAPHGISLFVDENIDPNSYYLVVGKNVVKKIKKDYESSEEATKRG